MINFDNLINLSKHYKYLQKKLGNKDIFLVGGCIRNNLLGIEKESLDIDLTLAGNPKQIFKNINKSDISIFKTDKFGTITIIPKKEDLKKIYGKKFDTELQGKLQYEITPFREEAEYNDFRHPDKIEWTNNLVNDSFRREFTISCLYYAQTQVKQLSYNGVQTFKDYKTLIKTLNINGYMFLEDFNILILQDHEIINEIVIDGEINNSKIKNIVKNSIAGRIGEQNDFVKSPSKSKNISLKVLFDPHNGLGDFYNFKLKCVGNPNLRFKEDALRIIRGIRFVNTINVKLPKYLDQKFEKNAFHNELMFDFEKKTWLSMKKNYYLVKFVAKERIRTEIVKIFKNNNPAGFIALLDELNLIKELFPALYHTKHNDQPTRYHSLDTFSHTLLSLFAMQGFNTNYLAKLAMLYHDVAKPDQYYYMGLDLNEEDHKTAHSREIYHTYAGVDLCKNDFSKLGFSNKEIIEICWYIENHMLPGYIESAKPENVEKKLKKLLAENSLEKINNLLDIALADRLGQFNPIQGLQVEGIKKMKKLLESIYAKQGQFSRRNLAISGNDIIKYFGIGPGPKIGELLQLGFDRVVEDSKQRNNKELILEYLENKL